MKIQEKKQTMLMENNTIQIAISSVTLLGIAGYIIHSVVSGYLKFRKDMYQKLEEKLNESQCNEYRRIEERHEDSHNREDK